MNKLNGLKRALITGYLAFSGFYAQTEQQYDLRSRNLQDILEIKKESVYYTEEIKYECENRQISFSFSLLDKKIVAQIGVKEKENENGFFGFMFSGKSYSARIVDNPEYGSINEVSLSFKDTSKKIRRTKEIRNPFGEVREDMNMLYNIVLEQIVNKKTLSEEDIETMHEIYLKYFPEAGDDLFSGKYEKHQKTKKAAFNLSGFEEKMQKLSEDIRKLNQKISSPKNTGLGFWLLKML